jgi:hypothetical protein
MSVAHSSEAHMVCEWEWGDPAEFLELLGLVYRRNISLWKQLHFNRFFNQTKNEGPLRSTWLCSRTKHIPY